MTLAKSKAVESLTTDDIDLMLEDLEDHYEDDQLDKWEEAFYKNIKAARELDHELTDLQLIKLKDMWDDYCG